MAAGAILARGNRVLVRRLSEEGGERLEFAESNDFAIQPSDIVRLSPKNRRKSDEFFLRGAVSVPGSRSLREQNTLSDVLANGLALEPNAYLPFAILRRLQPTTMVQSVHAISLSDTLIGKSDLVLRDQDEIIVF